MRILFLPVMAALTVGVPLGFEAAGRPHRPTAPPQTMVPEQGPLRGVGSASGASSALALGRRGETTFAYAADEDEEMLLSFALPNPSAPSVRRREIEEEAKPRLVAATRLPGRPASVLVTPSGRVVVALRDRSKVAVLRDTGAGALALDREIDTCTEPVGLALGADGDRLAVACAWGNAIGRISLARGRTLGVTKVAREPRAVAFDDSTGAVYVAHAVGSRVTRVDWEDGSAHDAPLRPTTERSVRAQPIESAFDFPIDPTDDEITLNQGFTLAVLPGETTRLLLPEVAVRTNGRQARAIATTGYGGSGLNMFRMDPIALTDVAVYDVAERRLGETKFSSGIGACRLPRASVLDKKRGLFFVSCFDNAHVTLYTLEGSTVFPYESWRVGDGPTGVGWIADRSQLVVWSAFDRVLTLIDSVDGQVSDSHDRKAPSGITFASDTVARTPTPFEVGRKLFHATDHGGISNDGRACASCHPDGRDDGLVWSSPNGPRQTPTLAGRLAETAPFGWNGESKTVREHVVQTMTRLGGHGLGSNELYALLVYLARMPGPPPAAAPLPDEPIAGNALAAMERGRAIFQSTGAGCASCHDPGYGFTDGDRHDVGSKTAGDPIAALDTPSLRFVGRTAPYFHDGRFPTLGALLRGVDGKMGRTGHLSEGDLAALEAYLASL